jgi:hypothetical protein
MTHACTASFWLAPTRIATCTVCGAQWRMCTPDQRLTAMLDALRADIESVPFPDNTGLTPTEQAS